MKLLYVYIERFGNLFQDNEFIFSNEYIISYSKSAHILSVNKNINYLNEFYGEIISDITAIVGKNGVGKTTLLNLIGRNFKDRLELSNVNEKREIADSYFLIYYVKDGVFYFEGAGQNFIKNIEGNVNVDNSKFCSFYFEYENSNCKIIQYKNKINEKILYINNDYVDSTEDLVKAMIYDEDEMVFLPRILGNKLSLVEWYSVYIDLCEQNMVSSKEITIIFNKNSEIKYENYFIIQPSVKHCTYNIDKILYTEENIEDFYSHLMSCIIGYFIKLSENVCEEEINKNWRKLKDKYEKKTSFSYLDYNTIFKECETIVKKNRKKYINNDIEVLIKFIENVSKLFFSLYDIKQHVIPGINEFKLKLSGENKNRKIESFFYTFIELQEFINNTFENNNRKEDSRYYEDGVPSKYHANSLKVEMPIDIYRVNISTGEKNLIGLLSTIIHEVKSFSEIQPIRLTKQEKTYIMLVDEIEAEMHLDWSRNLLDFIIKYLKKQTINTGWGSTSFLELNIKIQLIITTHSPFMLSDLNKNSIIALELKDGKAIKKKEIGAFAQNIQRIMSHEFFIHDCYGAFAQNKIQNIIERLNNKEALRYSEKENIRLIIEEIGEPLLKNKINEMYINKLGNEKNDNFEEIRLINRLKDIYGDLDNEELVEKIKQLIKSNTND